jgi:hypothetical protein
MGMMRLGLLSDPMQVLERLRAGDALVMTAHGWRLVRAECDVAREAVEALRLGGGPWFGQAGGLERVRGRLVPVGDVLPGLFAQLSQTWRWEGPGRRRA